MPTASSMRLIHLTIHILYIGIISTFLPSDPWSYLFRSLLPVWLSMTTVSSGTAVAVNDLWHITAMHSDLSIPQNRPRNRTGSRTSVRLSAREVSKSDRPTPTPEKICLEGPEWSQGRVRTSHFPSWSLGLRLPCLYRLHSGSGDGGSRLPKATGARRRLCEASWCCDVATAYHSHHILICFFFKEANVLVICRLLRGSEPATTSTLCHVDKLRQ